MSVIFGMQTKDLIGATVVDVDGRDVDADMFDFENITLELSNSRKVMVRGISDDMFGGIKLDIVGE